ncbi:DUF3052 domain-containing protein [Kitasatospora sp. NPDC008115]|uniref:DUF3052 domain-containing protein n=1 Tax=Kitasatospora sp. NPDC008115 TaxID=3364022 RepID=UPI0036F11993
MTAEATIATKLGIQPGTVAMEIGHDDDVDSELREAVEKATGADLLSDESGEVVDVVLAWFREDDGDLMDFLVDARAPLAEGGIIWLLTPKTGRDGYVEPSDISEAASSAGLARTSTISAVSEWSATRLVGPRG